MQFMPLTKDQYTLVDDDDYTWLSRWKWSIGTSGYACRTDKSRKSKTVFMHREIAKTPSGMLTDHINGKPLDNRRSNLRVCDKYQNMQNRRWTQGKSAKYIGMFWVAARSKWRACINQNGHRLYLGYFDKPEDAARAYDAKAVELRGDKTPTNASLRRYAYS